MLDTILTWQFWLILATICVFIELLTNTFALFAMAGGCLVAMILDLIGMGYVAELVGFSVGTVATFVCLKPFVKRHLESKKNGSYQSNIEALIGREATVTQDSNGEGITRIKIDGDNWQAHTADYGRLAVGDRVRVVAYDSIVLTVERV